MPFLFSNQEVHRQIIENGFGNLQRDQNMNVRQRRFTRMILREFDRVPTTSVRRVSCPLGISASHVHRDLRNDHRRPYHLQPVQGLQPGDGERRITFCQWILDRTDNNREFLSNVLWTDESCFTRRGVVNFHNHHIWSHENPHAIGIYRNRLFGPYLLPARLNAATFLEFLKTEHANMWDDLDGCPAHYSRIVRNWLDENYPERWIGLGGPTPVTTRDMLIDSIRNACDEIRPHLNNAIPRSIIRRCELCIEQLVIRKMELNREHFRAIIYYNFQRQLSQQECLAELLSVFGNDAPHQSTISRWYGEFKRGRVSLSDDPRVGAPKTAVTQENVDAVRKLIIEDRHTSVQKNLHEELGVRQLVSAARVNWCQKTLDRFNSGSSKNVYRIVSGDESWIYCCEPENKRQSAPTKIISSRSVSKKMVSTFVSKAGHIATIPLNEQRNITAEWYTTICLAKVITELRKIKPERRIILHEDNASSHTAQKTRQYLTKENVELFDHPPYSPDLSPNDLFTFPKIKNRLRGQRFQSPEEAVDAFKYAVLDLPANEWNKCFENWFERMQMCINLRGEYFEKQSSHLKLPTVVWDGLN
ncbi:unnamed protein product [Acanthoscelides obtectus]|uniref:Transposase n=1 Tax=Acanthoscelides obtectus TaxID=200917 RepID=A0A9P0KYH7_ACAOB|nr:unnamed protein product [Acanthoscelides obtectus]CAK1662959.1 Histone-lysine N-methyltransferase SETMAR [Acanthoscelides obtectus]